MLSSNSVITEMPCGSVEHWRSSWIGRPQLDLVRAMVKEHNRRPDT